MTEKSGLSKGLSAVGYVLKKIGAFFATFLMVGVITGSIVACVLTVYVLGSMDVENPIDLDAVALGYTSVIVAYDKEGNLVELERLYMTDNNRIPIESLDEVSPHVINALIATEDKRFWSHDGVDWVRSAGAFVGYVIPNSSVVGGGSTIHQQLIKNVTGDDDVRVDRKIREIFSAMDLGRRYKREDVLLAYLNVASFGAGTSGIEAAAQTYYGKSAKDLSLAESASIVGITQFPSAFNPLWYPEQNKKRQELVLKYMLKQEIIDEEVYNEAINEKLNFKKAVTKEEILEPTSYFVDHVIESVIKDFEKKGMTRQEAADAVYRGGYTIYATVDLEIQASLEEFYKTSEGFPKISRPDYPQSAALVTDMNGKIVGIVGGIGPKVKSRSFNRATMAKRQPGSTFKPIGPYALAFEYNLIWPSSKIDDSPVTENNGKPWPSNYYGGYKGSITVEHAITNSVNTVAVKVAQRVTPAGLFDFYYYGLGITSLVDPTDIDVAPMALGGVTYGVTLIELTGAYQPLGNGGYFTKPYAYTKVVDPKDQIVLQPDIEPRQVLQEDTAVLLNKMIQKVVTIGTGTRGKIDGMPTAGKTGTTNENVDQWFVGMSPYYIATVWLGYDQPIVIDKYGKKVTNSVEYAGNPYPTPILFKSIMDPIHKDLEHKDFITSDQVVEQIYCTITGNLATQNCPQAKTWFKKSNLPPVCSGNHSTGVITDGGTGGDIGAESATDNERPQSGIEVASD